MNKNRHFLLVLELQRNMFLFSFSLRSRPMLCECLHSFPELDPVLEEERRDSLLPTTTTSSVFIPAPKEGVRIEGEEGELREEEMKEEKENGEEEKEVAGVTDNKEEM